MKLKLFIKVFILIIGMSSGIFSQYTPDMHFVDYNPVWQHVSIDTSFIIDNIIVVDGKAYISNGMDKFNTPKTIVKDSSLFIVYDYLSGEGVFVEKINVKTGKIVWNYHYDHRNKDKWEPFAYFYTNGSFYINENGDIEILSFREKYNYQSIYKTFSKKVLNYDSGELIKHTYGKAGDTTVAQLIISQFWNKSYLLPKGVDEYLYLSNLYQNSNSEDSIDIYSYTLNENGQALEKKYIRLDKNHSNNFIYSMGGVGKDSVYVFRSELQSTGGNITRFDYYFDIYDREMNLLLSRKLDEMVFDKDADQTVLFPYNDDKVIVFELFENQESYYYFYDYQGNFLGKYLIKLDGDVNLYRKSVTKLKDGSFLVCATTYDFYEKGDTSELCFLKIDLDSDRVKLLKKIKVSPVDNFLHTQFVQELDNGDIIVGGRHLYHPYGEDGKPTSGWGDGYGQISICFRAEDLGLKTSVVQVPTQEKSLTIFPNPAKDKINISIDDGVAGKLSIYDILGQRVATGKINGTQKELDICSLTTGIYSVVVNTNAGKTLRGSFVKE